MCGIGGIYYFKNSPGREQLSKSLASMMSTLVHRGPDSQNLKLINDRLGFFHTRLNIIDPEARSDQPMFTENKSVITYNGEIYNFDDLRYADIAYRTQSDTEVMLTGLERENSDFLDKTNGMYSFAFWNEQKQELVLGRDPVGIKPLYYYLDVEKLIFASEIKAISVLDNIDRSLNSNIVHQYFSLGFIVGNNSALSNVKQLPPGAVARIKENELKIETGKSWKISASDRTEYESFLKKCSQRRLVSDVPLTAFLSGGIDSASLAVALADKDVTFSTLDLKGSGFSEIDKAEEVTKLLNLKQHSFEQNSLSFEDLKKIIYYADDLICDPALISNYQLYESVSKEFKVGLSGDGADELFLGYHAHFATYLTERYNLGVLGTGFSLLGLIIEAFESPRKYQTSEKLKRFGIYSKRKFPNNHLMWRSPGVDDLLIDQGEFTYTGNTFSDQPLDKRMSLVDLVTYLEGNILKKVDRMSMAHSMEVRVPFLDREMIEFALGLDMNYKMDLKSQKILMRKYLKNRLPKSIYAQEKTGFGSALDIVLDREKIKTELFDSGCVFFDFVSKKRLEDRFDSLNAYQIFCFYVFGQWLNNHRLNA